MSVSLSTASLRAAFNRELLRLHARPLEGGPMTMVRDGWLIAFDDSGEREHGVTQLTVAALARLHDGAGADEAWAVILKSEEICSP